jgi:hypothetical protein
MNQTVLSLSELSQSMADELGETTPGPRKALFRIARVLGPDQSTALLEKTREVEAAGGVMTPDGSRRRTPGGVFFFLAKEHMTDEQRQLVWPATKPRSAKLTSTTPPAEPADKANNSTALKQQPSASAVTNQGKRRADVAQREESQPAAPSKSDNQKGQATTVKMTLIGRPGPILDKGTYIITLMESTKVPMLPKGLPAISGEPTLYAVSIAAKQWKKVSEAIVADPDDTLIIEGYPTLDVPNQLIAVSATSVKSKKQDMAAKQQKENETRA